MVSELCPNFVADKRLWRWIEEMMRDLTSVKDVADIRNTEVMMLLLKERGSELKITEEMVKTAAGNIWNTEVMNPFRKERDTEVEMTERSLRLRR